MIIKIYIPVSLRHSALLQLVFSILFNIIMICSISSNLHLIPPFPSSSLPPTLCSISPSISVLAASLPNLSPNLWQLHRSPQPHPVPYPLRYLTRPFTSPAPVPHPAICLSRSAAIIASNRTASSVAPLTSSSRTQSSIIHDSYWHLL